MHPGSPLFYFSSLSPSLLSLSILSLSLLLLKPGRGTEIPAEPVPHLVSKPGFSTKPGLVTRGANSHMQKLPSRTFFFNSISKHLYHRWVALQVFLQEGVLGPFKLGALLIYQCLEETRTGAVGRQNDRQGCGEGLREDLELYKGMFVHYVKFAMHCTNIKIFAFGARVIAQWGGFLPRMQPT